MSRPPDARLAAPRPSRRAAGIYAAALLALVLAVYAPVFRYSYVMDDWVIVNFVRSTPAPEALQRLWNPANRVFFRPLSGTYYLPLIRVFGLSSAGFHAGALLLLALGAGLAAAVIRDLTGRPRLAAAVGLLYAAAAPVHLDPMTWMVGANELFAAATLLGALLLFLRGRDRTAAAVWFVSLLFNEAGLFLPLLLCAAGIGRPARGWPKLLAARLGPFALAALAALLPKLAGRPLPGLPDGHPYALRIWGAHVFDNLARYGKWAMETLFPFLIENPAKEKLAAWGLGHAAFTSAALALAAAASAAVLVRFRPGRVPRSALPVPVFLLLWLGLGLLPPVFFPNHAYRYYLTYSLPPLLALFLMTADRAVSVAARDRRARWAAAGLWLLLSLGASRAFYHRRAAEGLNQRFRDGTCSLFERGALARILREDLQRLHPSLPRGCALVFDGFKPYTVQGEALLRAVYGDPDLRVFERSRIAADATGLQAILPALDGYGARLPGQPARRIPLPADRTLAFRLEGGRLTDITAEIAPPLAPPEEAR